MFFISDDHNLLTVETLSKSFDSQIKTFVIDKPSQVVVIGKNSIFNNHIDTYLKKSSIAFDAKIFVDLDEEVKLKIYSLSANAGYLIHNQVENLVWISQSFSLLVDYALGLGISILGIIRQSKGPDFTIPNNIINNDFSKKILTEEDTDPDKHFYFDLSWTPSDDFVKFGMIINIDDYRQNLAGMFFEEYRGTALNIGKFRQIILKELDEDQRKPDYFPEAELHFCIEFSELDDDNAYTILVPNVFSHQEYEFLLQTLKRNNQTQICISGTSKNGYGIQATIERLPNYESTLSYQAKVTKLIISPNANITKSIGANT